jgi:hypothetical protein
MSKNVNYRIWHNGSLAAAKDPGTIPQIIGGHWSGDLWAIDAPAVIETARRFRAPACAFFDKLTLDGCGVGRHAAMPACATRSEWRARGTHVN